MASCRNADIVSSENYSGQSEVRMRYSREMEQSQHAVRANRSARKNHDRYKKVALAASQEENSKTLPCGRNRPKRRWITTQMCRSLDPWILLAALGLVIYRAHHIFYTNVTNLSKDNEQFRIPVDPFEARILGNFKGTLSSLTVEIFSAPKPFIGKDNATNRRAIESWSKLRPKPKITLLGCEVGYLEAAKDYSLNIETRVDKTFLGIPMFNSMIDRANRSEAKVAVVINGDILLYDDFMQTIRRVVSSFQDFLIVGARYDVDELPADSENDLPRIRSHVVEHGMLHTYGGMDVWVWNTDGPPLYRPVMPHFIFGRGKYDNWITHEAIEAGYRQVIDASETCLLVHVRHDYHLVAGNENHKHSRQSQYGHFDLVRASGAQFWSEGKRSKYELFINIFLSLHIGTYTNQMGSVLFAPWKLARCAEPSGMCLINRKRPGKCPCEYSSYTRLTQTDPTVKEGSRVLRCGLLSKETKETFSIPVSSSDVEEEPSSFGMPLTMRSVAEKVVSNNTIILTAVTFGYRTFLMNWVCNLREMGISNFVVAALDVDMYKYGYIRGIPTYHESSVFDQDANLTDATYGTDKFKQITKAKSKVVLRFLKQGYNVLWSDCDVIFFKNPLAYLWSMNGDLVIQSNAPDGEPSNARRRLNSGFYLAVVSPQMVVAFERILKYALRSSMSEQPCFYDILCGKLGEHAVGVDACNGQGVMVKVLDRALFPNGLTQKIWETENGSIKEKFPKIYILHNNWEKGSEAKRQRLERHGLVTYSTNTELCTYDTIV